MLLPNHEISSGSLLCNSTVASLLTNTRSSGDMTATCTNNTDAAFLRPTSVTNNLKLDITGAGSGSSVWRLEWVVSQPLHQVSRFQVPIYMSTDPPGGLGCTMYISDSGSFANNYQYGPFTVTPNVMRKGWNLQTLDVNVPTTSSGSPTRTMTVTNIRWNITIPAGYTGTFYIGPIYINKHNRPKVCIGFDDGNYTAAWTAAQYMTARDVPGYWCPPTAQIDIGGVTTAQLQTLHGLGWSIHNQTVSDTVLTGLSKSAVQSIVRTAQDTLDGKGLIYGRRTIAYPTGATDDTVIQAVSELGYTHGAIVRQQVEKHWDGIDQPFRINRTNMASSSLATLTGLIDTAVNRGGYIIFFVHDVTGVPSMATFQGVVDYAVKLRDGNVLDIVSLQAFIDQMSDPRRQRL